jgi:hypothetical protein
MFCRVQCLHMALPERARELGVRWVKVEHRNNGVDDDSGNDVSICLYLDQDTENQNDMKITEDVHP